MADPATADSRAHEISMAQSPGADAPLTTGDVVQLVGSVQSLSPICLEPQESGVIIATDLSDIPLQVRGPRGDTTWFPVAWLKRANSATLFPGSNAVADDEHAEKPANEYSVMWVRGAGMDEMNGEYLRPDDAVRNGRPMWQKKDTPYTILFNNFEWRLLSADNPESEYYYVKFADCDGGSTFPHEAKWEVSSGAKEPAPTVSCRERDPPSTLRQWSQGAPSGASDFVEGELGAAVGITGDPIETDGFLVALSLRWGPGAITGMTYAVGVFEINDGHAKLRTRHPFTSSTDHNQQRILLNYPLQVKTGQFLGLLNLDDKFCSVGYYRPKDNGSDRERPPPSLYGVDCYSARSFVQGSRVEVVPAAATLQVRWELQSELSADSDSTVKGKGKEPRLCWSVGPEDLRRSSGQLGAAVGITTPAITEAGRCVGLDVAFGNVATDNFAVGVFDYEEYARDGSGSGQRARLVAHCDIKVAPGMADEVQSIELSSPLQVMSGQYLGILNLANAFCSVKYRAVASNEPPSLYGGNCQSSDQFFTGEFCGLNSTSNTLCVQWHMESGELDDSYGGRSLVPDGTTAFEIIGTEDPTINGLYTVTKLDGYAGPDSYRRQHSTVVMFRWEREHWILADLGPTMDRFTDQTCWLYRVPSGSPPSATPPTTEWNRVPPRSDLPAKLEILQAIQVGSPQARLLLQQQQSVPTPVFDPSASSTALVFKSSDTIAERPGMVDCYPAALIPISDGSFAITLRLLSSTRKGNAFSFGVASAMRTSYGDGFGFEEGSIGLMQDCAEGDPSPARFVWTREKRTIRDLDIRLEEDSTVSLRLRGGEVTFWINDTLIDTVPAPPGVSVAGCSLHTSGMVKIEPFKFDTPCSVETEEGVRVARPAAPLIGAVESAISDTGAGKVEILEGLCVFLSEESVMSGASDSVAWRLRFSGNDSFSIGAISAADVPRASECLFEDPEYPLAVNSSGTFGGNLQRLLMSDTDVIVCLKGSTSTLEVYTEGSHLPVKTLPWGAQVGSSDGGGSGPGATDTDLAKMHLAICGFDGCTVDFKPVGKFLSPVCAVVAAVPSREELCGDPFMQYGLDSDTVFIETGGGPSVFISKQAVVMGRPEKLAWHCVISGNAAFSVGALPTDFLDAESAAACLHENTTAPLTINSSETRGGNERKCAMMSPQGVVIVLDAGARTLCVYKGPNRHEPLGAPLQTINVPDSIDVPIHLAMNGFQGTNFRFLKLSPTLLDAQEPGAQPHFPLRVGDRVELTRNHASFADAAGGPLQPPSVGGPRSFGTIIRVRVGELGYTDQYRVRVQDDDEWWYHIKAVQLVGSQPEAVEVGSGRGATTPELRWVAVGSERGLTITDNGRGIKYNSRREGVRADLPMHVGKYVWSVKLEEGDRDATIGVCEKAADLNCRDYAQQHVWCWELDDGDLNEETHKKQQGKFMKKPDKGHRVFCHLDTKIGTLGYSVDSGPVKIAFTGLRGKTLYPYALLGSSNEWTDLTLVEAPDLSQFQIFELRGAGTEVVNGWYSPISIHRYSGLEPFGKRGDDALVLMRWERSKWLCVDMGEGRTKFPGKGGRILYECPCTTDLPPADGWIAVEGSVPVFRISGVDGLSQPRYTPEAVAGPSSDLAKMWTCPFVQVGSCFGPLYDEKTGKCWMNGELGRVTLIEAAAAEVRRCSELGKRIESYGPQYSKLPRAEEELIRRSFERRCLAEGENSTVSVQIPRAFSQNLKRFSLQYFAIRRRIAAVSEDGETSAPAKAAGQAKTLLKFDPEISSTDLIFDTDNYQYVERPSTEGCYPAALIAVDSDHFALTVKIEHETDKGNSFSFGVATTMRKTYGDGFGPERSSVGLFQNCGSSDSSVKFIDSHSSDRTENDLERRLEAGSVVSLVLYKDRVTFWIDGDEVASAKVSEIKIAGCTMNSDGAVSIRPLPDHIAQQFDTSISSGAPAASVAAVPSEVPAVPAADEEVGFLTDAEVAAMSFEDQMAYMMRMSAQEERRQREAEERRQHEAEAAAALAAAVTSEGGDAAAVDSTKDGSKGGAGEDAPTGTESGAAEGADTDPTEEHPTGLLRSLVTATVFASRCSIVGPDAVTLGQIEEGKEVRALRTVTEDRTIAAIDDDPTTGITSKITWTLVEFPGAPGAEGWVTEQVDGEKMFQRYREVVQEDPPILCTSPFFVQVDGERFDSFEAAVARKPHVANADTVTIGTCFAASLQPGVEYKFCVAYLGEEEAEISVSSEEYMCARGSDIELKTIQDEAGCSAAVVKWTSLLESKPDLVGVRLGYRILCDPRNTCGSGGARYGCGIRMDDQEQDTRVLLRRDVSELRVDGLAAWTPYIFTVAGVKADDSVLQASESSVFIWAPPQDIPPPEVKVAATNQSLLVTSNMLDLSDRPSAASVLGALTYRVLQKKEDCESALFEPIGPPLKLSSMSRRISALNSLTVNFWNPVDKHESIILRKDNTEVTYRQSNGRNAIVRAKYPLGRGRHFWETTIVKFDGGGSGYNFIGVATSSVNVQEVLSSTNAGPGVWAIQLGDEMKRFRNGRDRERWMSCGYKSGLVIGLLVDTTMGTLDVYVNREKKGQAFDDLPRGEPLFPVIGAGCLVPNVYRTDFAAPMPSQVSSALNPEHNTLSVGAKVFSAPTGERMLNPVPRGSLGYFVKDTGPTSCVVDFPEVLGLVEVPLTELALPNTSSASIGSRSTETDGLEVLRNVVRVMTSLDPNQVTQHLIDRTLHMDNVPSASGNDAFWRAQVKDVTESMLAGYQRSGFAKKKRRHEDGSCLLSPEALQAIDTALKNLTAPYVAEVPAAPGKRFTFKTEVTLGLSGSSSLLVANAPLVSAAMGGELGTIRASPCKGDRVQLSSFGDKDRCLDSGDIGVVVDCLSSSGKPVKVRSPSGKVSQYRAKELSVVGPVPVLVHRPVIGDTVQLAQFATDRDGCLLSNSDVGIIVRDDPKSPFPFCVSCNGDIHNYALLDLEVCKAPPPVAPQSGPRVISASSNLESAKAALFDDADETFWETDGNKPHWVHIELPRQFDAFQIKTYPFGGSYEAHKICVRACRKGTKRTAARRILTDVNLPTDEEVNYTLFRSSVLTPSEDAIFFEIHGCGPSNSGANCKVRGFHITGVKRLTDDRPVTLPGASSSWILEHPRSCSIDYTVPYEPPTAPIQLSLARSASGAVELSWKPPRYDGGQPVQSYRVRVTTASNVISTEFPQDSKVQSFETTEQRLELPTVAPLSHCTCVVSAVNVVGEGAPSEKPAQLCKGDVIVLPNLPSSESSIVGVLPAPFSGDVWRLRSAPTSSLAFSRIDMKKECLDKSLQGVSIFHVLATSPDTYDLQQLLMAMASTEGLRAALGLANDDGRTPLLVAAASLNVQAVNMFLDVIEKLDDHDLICKIAGAADNLGNTAAHHLVTIDASVAVLPDTDICAILFTRLAKYANPKTQNKVGETVFTRALKFGNTPFAAWMLKSGVFAEGAALIDGAGNSALHLGTLLLLNQSTTGGSSLRFTFDEENKSPFLHLSGDCREVIRNDSDGTRSIRLMPPMSSGRHTVSFRISRSRTRDGQGGLGSGYYVGVVDPSFDSWDNRIHQPPLGFGMEDDNSSSSRRWHFRGNPSNAYRSGDVITFEVDFGAGTIVISRNKGAADEVRFTTEIPASMETLHFAMTIYNTDASCELLDMGREYGLDMESSESSSDSTQEATELELVDELCGVVEKLQDIEGLMEQSNNDGVTPTEMVLFSTLTDIPSESAKTAARARVRIGELFFGNAESCIAMLKGSGGSLPTVYNSLSSAFFDSIVQAMRVSDDTSVIQPFVRSTAVIYTQCFAHTLRINDATTLDDVGTRILCNIRSTFEAFPHFAILELGECARALAEPLVNNAVIPLKVQMNPCRGSTVLRRPAFAGEPKTHTVTEFVSTNLGPREAFKDIVKDILQVGAKCDDEKLASLSERLAALPDINTLRSTSTGVSLLHVVCDVNKVALIQLLLRHGCDINARDNHGEVPLHAAVKAGHRNVVSALLQQAGILPNVATPEAGLTPLHMACSKEVRVDGACRLAMVRTLLQGGADATTFSNAGLTPLDIAEQNEFERCAAELAAWPISVVLSDAESPSRRNVRDRILRATIVVPKVDTEVSDSQVEAAPAESEAAPAAVEDGLTEEELARRREEEDLELARRLQEEEQRAQRGGRADRAAADAGTPSTSTPSSTFGTWVRQIPSTESRKSTVRVIKMQERLALAAARLIKEQIRVLDGVGAAREKGTCSDISVSDVRRVFLVLTNDLWAYVATEMDCFEANLRAGLEHAKLHAQASGSKKLRVPTSQDDLADIYMASLLDTHHGGLMDAQPCTDVTAYGHVAVLVDALMLALPRLQSGSDQSLVSPAKRSKSPFFRRTESISVAGATDSEIKLELPVAQVLPLAHNPFLLMSRRGEKFGGKTAEAHDDAPVHRHSGRIQENALPACVSGQEVVRIWTGPPVNAPLRRHQGWESAVNFDQPRSLESTFLNRWQTSLEIMASEYAHFFSEGERAGFFSSALMRLLSVEAKQKIFAERLKMHPKRGKSLVRFSVSRKDILTSSSRAIAREVERKKFPMIVESVSFDDERGVGEGVTRGWWSAVSTALGQQCSIFDPKLAGSAESVTIIQRVQEGSEDSPPVLCIKLPGVPMVPHRNPVFVKWLVQPANAVVDTEVTFVEVSNVVGGTVTLSDGSKFENPANHTKLKTPYRHQPRKKDEAAPVEKAVPDLEWAATGRGATIEDGGTSVGYSGSRCGCIGNIGFKEGQHVFEVHLNKGDRDAAFGVAAVDVSLDHRDYAAARTWVWVLDDRYLCENGSKLRKGAQYCRKPEVGETIRCHVNADEGTVSFQINDEAIIPAFSNLKSVIDSGGLFPFCKLGSSNAWTNLRYVSGTKPPILYPGPKISQKSSARQLFYEPGNRGFFAPCVVADNEWSPELEAEYRFAGRFVALALFSNTRIWFRLSRHVIKYMLRKPVQWHDLAFYSTEKYEKYRSYITNPMGTIQYGDTFEIDLQDSAGLTLTELEPGGKDLAVCPENVEKFVELSARMLMIDSVRKPLDALRAGLEDVFPVPSILDILTAEDFAVILNGSPEIETTLLRNHTDCSGANKKWYDEFWTVVDKMSPMDKSNLLAFWTGSACVPSDLSRWKLRLEVHREAPELPEAATCSRQLRVPKYSSAAVLESKLRLAIQESSYMQA